MQLACCIGAYSDGPDMIFVCSNMFHGQNLTLEKDNICIYVGVPRIRSIDHALSLITNNMKHGLWLGSDAQENRRHVGCIIDSRPKFLKHFPNNFHSGPKPSLVATFCSGTRG